MSSPSTADPKDIQAVSVVPILRMYDVAATIRFCVEYLGWAGRRHLALSVPIRQMPWPSGRSDATGTAALPTSGVDGAVHYELVPGPALPADARFKPDVVSPSVLASDHCCSTLVLARWSRG